jgi:Domain of unknown function (DUF4682)
MFHTFFYIPRMIYSKVKGESEKMAVANAWQSNRLKENPHQREQSDREKIALDITVLKKQYDKLRERQKQAHIILTAAVSKQNQHAQQHQTITNKLLKGKSAIVSKGRRGPPKGSNYLYLFKGYCPNVPRKIF